MMEMIQNNKILVVDDEKNMRRIIGAMLVKEGFSPIEAESGRDALNLIGTAMPFCIITDLKMPDVDGLELLDRVKEMGMDLPVIMITAHGTIDTAVKAMKKGAFDYLTKPFEKAELLNVVRRAAKTSNIKRAEPSLGLPRQDFIESSDPAMDEVMKLITRVSTTDITALISGESGTGKELVARMIHESGKRSDEPFVAINCAAIPEDLTESELFGYEKGAFTGATYSKPGRFELADKGTLFLDEIGTLTPKVQGKLLRVLQEQSFIRVGGIKTISVDTRLIAATNADLKAEVEQGRFREDLFYRLNVVRIHLPPLRQRTADIIPLADYFRRRFSQKMGKRIDGFDDEVKAGILLYNWPGNIRELENAMERAVLMADGEKITIHDLSSEIAMKDDGASASQADGTLREKIKDATNRLERQMILEALEETGNNVTKAALRLGLSRKGLQLKMKALGLRGTGDS